MLVLVELLGGVVVGCPRFLRGLSLLGVSAGRREGGEVGAILEGLHVLVVDVASLAIGVLAIARLAFGNSAGAGAYTCKSAGRLLLLERTRSAFLRLVDLSVLGLRTGVGDVASRGLDVRAAALLLVLLLLPSLALAIVVDLARLDGLLGLQLLLVVLLSVTDDALESGVVDNLGVIPASVLLLALGKRILLPINLELVEVVGNPAHVVAASSRSKLLRVVLEVGVCTTQ